jgi:hypothetical protein
LKNRLFFQPLNLSRVRNWFQAFAFSNATFYYRYTEAFHRLGFLRAALVDHAAGAGYRLHGGVSNAA